MNEKKNFPWWGVALGVGCICIFCVGVLGVGAFTYAYLNKSPLPLLSFNQLEPTIAPVIPEPGTSRPSLTGNQQLDEYYFYDDFSSEALAWPVYDDGTTILKYEDGQYSIQITESDYYDWAFIPVDFSPVDVFFDAKNVNVEKDGAFGVFCHYQDEDNYYYVGFDLENREYIIGYAVDGEDIPLTPEGSQDYYWQVTNAFKSSSSAVNRIGISCYRDFITLFINGEWITEITIPAPFSEPGAMAFYVWTFDFAGAEGYKVYFDNVEVYIPVQ